MGLLDRMGQAIRAQVNSLIQENQDPEKLLEKAILEMEGELIQMRQALAAAVATQKRTERQRQQQEKAAQTWHERAQLALHHGN
ncbi:MAG: PspA/IM30 family protein, partial [Microcystis panniformis]